MSTAKKFREDLSSEEDLKEGDWVLVEVGPKPNNRPVWIKPLEGEPTEHGMVEKAYVRRLIRLPSGPTPRSLGTAASASAPSSTHAKKIFDLRNLVPPKKWPKAHLSPIGSLTQGTAHDVGQASFVTLEASNGATVYFDVGRPLWFQISSLPKRKRLSLPTPTKGDLVVLSHWDWDHFSHGRAHNAFHQVPWIAPAQIVGPGAYHFAEKLHGHGMLNLVRDSRRYRPKNGSLHLYSCPFSASDRNSSGIIAVAHLASGNSVLLTGDCDYDTINRRPLPIATYSTIIIPHHGGELPGTPPPISANGKFVVSYGLPNKYGHPKPSVISQHAAISSALEGTADNLQPRFPLMMRQARGSRNL